MKHLKQFERLSCFPFTHISSHCSLWELCSNMPKSANCWPYYPDRSCCARPLNAAAANRYAVWCQGTIEVGRTDLQISTMTIFIDLAKSGETRCNPFTTPAIYGSSTGFWPTLRWQVNTTSEAITSIASFCLLFYHLLWLSVSPSVVEFHPPAAWKKKHIHDHQINWKITGNESLIFISDSSRVLFLNSVVISAKNN